MVHLLEQALGMRVNVSEDAHFCGALGAALFAHDRVFGVQPEAVAA
jgi:activator of 2-hydroxyglutaryl-CoA dehydratase